MSANIEQIKAMLERTEKTNLLQKQKVDLDKEQLQLEATVNIEMMDKSLQEEIETWIPAHISIRTDETLPINPTELTDVCKEWGKGIARHFAQWGAEHLRDTTKMTDKSLDEAAENAMPKEPAYFADEFTEDGPKSEPVYDVEQMKAMYKASVEWQKQQMPMPEDTVLFNKGVQEGRRLEREDMLAKAVEGEYSAKFLGRTIYLRIPLDGFKPGDKVKLYVFKED